MFPRSVRTIDDQVAWNVAVRKQRIYWTAILLENTNLNKVQNDLWLDQVIENLPGKYSRSAKNKNNS